LAGLPADAVLAVWRVARQACDARLMASLLRLHLLVAVWVRRNVPGSAMDLSKEARRVGPALQTKRAQHPAGAAVSERGQVVVTLPHHRAAGRRLPP
jgi:hypothetical protein